MVKVKPFICTIRYPFSISCYPLSFSIFIIKVNYRNHKHWSGRQAFAIKLGTSWRILCSLVVVGCELSTTRCTGGSKSMQPYSLNFLVNPHFSSFFHHSKIMKFLIWNRDLNVLESNLLVSEVSWRWLRAHDSDDGSCLLSTHFFSFKWENLLLTFSFFSFYFDVSCLLFWSL